MHTGCEWCPWVVISGKGSNSRFRLSHEQFPEPFSSLPWVPTAAFSQFSHKQVVDGEVRQALSSASRVPSPPATYKATDP